MASGDQMPMWKLSEKMMRAQRCMRQKSAPTRSSGVMEAHVVERQLPVERPASPKNGVLPPIRAR